MEYTVGRRDANKADILIADKTISGIHAKIWFNGSNGSFWIEDLNSLNHTYILKNGIKKEVTFSTKISSSDSIIFGSKEIPFYIILEKINGKISSGIDENINDISKSIINIERCVVCGSPKTIGQECTKC